MFRNICLALVLCSTAAAVAQNDTQTSTPPLPEQQRPQSNVEPTAQTPIYRVNVVSRTTRAVNYQHRSGTTEVDMKGTDLMPLANGKAKVTSRQGRLEINLSMKKMRPATTFGPEYLTYVLWAITPEGRPVNLGEVLPNEDGNLDMRVTSDLQAFGLIITAEPYFAVTRPSALMVVDNQVLSSTKGWERPIDAKFDALDRAEYSVNLDASQLPATHGDRAKDGLDLLEARNAVAIAKAQGAEQYAPDALAKATDFLARAEDYLKRKQSRQAIGTVARGATQQAEDARVLTIRRKNEERIANERTRLQNQEAAARAQSEADAARAADEQRRREQAEADRRAAEAAQQQAEQAAQRASQERAAAEAAQQAALAQQQQLQTQMQAAQQQAQAATAAQQQAEQQREEMRARLLTQLNQVLQTKDTARGLIVNMSDVLFDTGKATLRPGARERLARVAGIILAYPDLRLQIEGYTDSVGSDAFNQALSEKRAAAVRDYLISQGVNLNSVTAQGYGKANPVASNTTAAGRQMNRRVDLVVSGQSIQSARSMNSTTTTTTTNGTAGAAGTTAAPATAPNNTNMPAQPVGNAPPTSNPRPPVTAPDPSQSSVPR